MADSRRHAATGSGRWFLLSVTAASVAALAAGGAFAISLHLVRLILTPQKTRPEDVEIIAVDQRSKTVTLSDHADAVIPGNYSLLFSNGSGLAQVGNIVGYSNGAVSRQLLSTQHGQLRRGLRVRVSGWFYQHPDELGYETEEVVVSTELGPAPAWLVRSTEDTGNWVIQVHGRGADRREPIRAIQVFRDAGYSSLLVSYRNDGVAPDASDGRYGLGDTEWADVDSAIEFARRHGARSIILMGWSMGGAIVLQAANRSRSSAVIAGVVLDSPVVDWFSVLDYQAASMRIPRFITRAVYLIITRRWGRALTGQAESIDLARLNFVRRAAELHTPILLMHSDSDTYVPPTGSRQLAKLRPDIVTFESFTGAGHTRLWNYDPYRWSTAIGNWLSKVPVERATFGVPDA